MLQRLDPAPLKFSWEKFSACAEELLPLFVLHWREVADNQDRIPLDVDVRKMLAFEQLGVLHVVAARAGGKLVGYVVILMGPHMHHASTQWAQFDGFWLHPDHRKGLAGFRMLRGAVAAVRKKGGKVLTVPVKQSFENARVNKLFERMGFVAADVLYKKVL